MNAIELIQHAADANPAQFQDTFNSLIADKVMDAIAAKKIEVAQNYFNVPQTSSEDAQ